MEISIKQAIIHVLDANVAVPVYSSVPMEQTLFVDEYIGQHLLNCFENDKLKRGRLDAAHPIVERLQRVEGSFVQVTQAMAGEIYELMLKAPAIPSADMLFVYFICEGRPFFAGLKMNYKEGLSHWSAQENGENLISLVRQQALLPGKSAKLDEAFLIDLSELAVGLLEKQYEIDGRRSFYLSTEILPCDFGMSEGEKLNHVRKAAKAINERLADVDKEITIKTNAALHEALAAEDDITIEDLCHEIYEDHPDAAAMIVEELSQKQVDTRQEIRPSEKAVKRLEKQSLKAANGIEIKIPVSLYQDPDCVEFINNPDGTISVLVKDILL